MNNHSFFYNFATHLCKSQEKMELKTRGLVTVFEVCTYLFSVCMEAVDGQKYIRNSKHKR